MVCDKRHHVGRMGLSKWVSASGCMLRTKEWGKWLEEAYAHAIMGERNWAAVKSIIESVLGGQIENNKHCRRAEVDLGVIVTKK